MPLTEKDFPEAMNGRFAPSVTALRCPKCRSRSFELIEVIDASTAWRVVNGRLNREDGFHEFGNPICVLAECSCGHHWKVRRATTVIQVVTDLDPKTLHPVT